MKLKMSDSFLREVFDKKKMWRNKKNIDRHKGKGAERGL